VRLKFASIFLAYLLSRRAIRVYHVMTSQ